jgi:hypothetical protein
LKELRDGKENFSGLNLSKGIEDGENERSIHFFPLPWEWYSDMRSRDTGQQVIKQATPPAVMDAGCSDPTARMKEQPCGPSTEEEC